MIWAFLSAKGFLGLAKGTWLLGAIVALIGAVVWLQARENADDKANQELGRTIEREEALTETIEQVEEAQDAREDNRTRTVEQRNADCVRRSRTPENC
jgi:predicted Holliday junction resolvase-like endonuclease